MANESETLYLVICGQYSDQYPAALFRDRDMATAFARAHEGNVQEMMVSTELDEKSQRRLTPGVYLFRVGMGPDGNGAGATERFDETEQMWLAFRLTDKGIQRFACDCYARDETHAIKILNERRGIWRAMGEPLGEPTKTGYGWRTWAPAEVAVT